MFWLLVTVANLYAHVHSHDKWWLFAAGVSAAFFLDDVFWKRTIKYFENDLKKHGEM